MTKPTYAAISQHAKNEKPALVFVPTRKHVRLTAMDLISYSNAGTRDKSFYCGTQKNLNRFLTRLVIKC